MKHELSGLKITHDYDDIIGLTPPSSALHPRMSAESRAAQFSPFAALTGYDAVIAETARYTENEIELTEEEQLRLSQRLLLLAKLLPEHPTVIMTLFLRDECKPGGRYETWIGTVRKIDSLERRLIWENGTVVPFCSILSLESDLFPAADTFLADNGCPDI